MKKSTFIVLLLLITLAAVAAAWFWALPPLIMGFDILHSPPWTEADLVRYLWHFRLIQPEWVSKPPSYDYQRWAGAETLARLAVVFVGWAASSLFIERLYLRSHRKPTPNPVLGCKFRL
jgi:hypothetical protein